MATVLITGASKGIGRSASKLFAKAGWNLMLIARSEKSLVSLKDELATKDIIISYMVMDLSDPSSITSNINRFIEENTVPSVVINNAGVAWTGDLLAMPLDSWQWIVQMNFTSVFQICSAVVPLMREKGGLIINVSSHAARNAFPQWGAYCATKAALASFTKCLAEEERRNSIRACTLTLGSVNTTLWDTDTVHGSFDRRAMLSSEDAARALLHLAEQPSSQIIEDLTLMPSSGAF